MTTSYSEIYDRFSTKLQDYTLDAMYSASLTNYESYLLGWLKTAITRFRKCTYTLTNRDDTTQTFNFVLPEYEQELLAELMLESWIGKEVNNIVEIRNRLNDTDFKTFSAKGNLDGKLKLQASILERNEQRLVEYSYDQFDWSKIGLTTTL